MDNFQLEPIDQSIFDLLFEIRKRPGFYLPEKSISRLHAFLTGYLSGLGQCGKTVKHGEEFHPFHDWVAAKLGYSSSTSGWCNMILDQTGNEEQAFDFFFELLEEFQRERGLKR